MNIVKGSIVLINMKKEPLEILIKYENGFIARGIYSRTDFYITMDMIIITAEND